MKFYPKMLINAGIGIRADNYRFHVSRKGWYDSSYCPFYVVTIWQIALCFQNPLKRIALLSLTDMRVFFLVLLLHAVTAFTKNVEPQLLLTRLKGQVKSVQTEVFREQYKFPGVLVNERSFMYLVGITSESFDKNGYHTEYTYQSENAKKNWWHTYKFDKDGRELEWNEYNSDGEVYYGSKLVLEGGLKRMFIMINAGGKTDTLFYEYDNLDSLVLSYRLDSAGIKRPEYKIMFDKNHRLKTMYYITPQGEIGEERISEYDRKNRLKSEHAINYRGWFGEDGPVQFTTTYKYCKKGKTVKVYSGKVSKKNIMEEFVFNKRNQIISELTYGVVGGYHSDCDDGLFEYQYDSLGRKTYLKIADRCENGDEINIREVDFYYGRNGSLIYKAERADGVAKRPAIKCSFDEQGNLLSLKKDEKVEQFYRYDNFGNVIWTSIEVDGQLDKESIQKFHFEYDEQDNWTEYYEEINGEMRLEVRREINYYASE